jgi:DNA-binding MarR family transcriptional regulator
MSSPISKPVPSAAELVEELLTVTHAIRREHNSRLASLDASIPRGRLLRAMTELGKPRMSELAASLGLTARTITTSVDTLEREGLLKRTPHPTDRRATLVELTNKGRSYVDDWRSFQRKLADEAMSPLSKQDRRDLKRILKLVGSAGLTEIGRVPSPSTVGRAHPRVRVPAAKRRRTA